MYIDGSDLAVPEVHRSGSAHMEHRTPGAALRTSPLPAGSATEVESLPRELLLRYLVSLQAWAAENRAAA